MEQQLRSQVLKALRQTYDEVDVLYKEMQELTDYANSIKYGQIKIIFEKRKNNFAIMRWKKVSKFINSNQLNDFIKEFPDIYKSLYIDVNTKMAWLNLKESLLRAKRNKYEKFLDQFK